MTQSEIKKMFFASIEPKLNGWDRWAINSMVKYVENKVMALEHLDMLYWGREELGEKMKDLRTERENELLKLSYSQKIYKMLNYYINRFYGLKKPESFIIYFIMRVFDKMKIDYILITDLDFVIKGIISNDLEFEFYKPDEYVGLILKNDRVVDFYNFEEFKLWIKALNGGGA